MTDFLLNRQLTALVDATSRAEGPLRAHLDQVLAALGADAPTPGEPTDATTDVLEDLTAIASVLDVLADGPGPLLAAAVRGVLAVHGRDVNDTMSPDRLAAELENLAASAPSVVAEPADAEAASEPEWPHEHDEWDEWEGEPATPVRHLLLVSATRADGQATTAGEVDAAIDQVAPTLAAVGHADQLTDVLLDGPRGVVALAIDSTDAGMQLGTAPAGRVVFCGAVTVGRVELQVDAVLVGTPDDALTAPDGGIDVDALLDDTDIDQALAAAGGIDETVATLRQRHTDMLDRMEADATGAGDTDAVAEIDSLRDAGPDVPTDATGRPLLEVRFRRADGGTLDGDDLDTVMAGAMQTLPRFGRLEVLDTTAEAGLSSLVLAVADTAGSQLTTADVADQTVTWQGTRPFPGIGDVHASLTLPAGATRREATGEADAATPTVHGRDDELAGDVAGARTSPAASTPEDELDVEQPETVLVQFTGARADVVAVLGAADLTREGLITGWQVDDEV